MFLSHKDRPGPLWRMSALRQAVILTSVFIALVAVAGVLAVAEFSRQFEDLIEDELHARFATISAEIDRLGFDPTRYQRTGSERVLVFSHPRTIRPGFHDHLDHGGGYGDRQPFVRGQWVYYAGPRGDRQLVVGTSLGRRDEFLEIMLQSLGFVGFGAALLALMIGVVLGLRTQRRLNRINTTLIRAAQGDLETRTKPARNRDDLDGLAHQVDDTLDQLDILMRQRRDFSANIAHDLKTPLSRLRIRLEKALSAQLDHGNSADDIGAAMEQTDKVIAIFDAFLRIAKLEAGRLKTSFQTLDPGDVLREISDAYGVVVEDGGRSLSLDIRSPEPIFADRVLLVQMLANLIENAIRHTPKGTHLRLIAHGYELGLADTGPGIAPEERDRVTKPLYRLEKSRTTEGTGLGLALVKTIATLHKARLILSDNPEMQSGGLYIRAVFDPDI